jgi:hypothetical protein
MKVQRDEGDGRILLDDNAGGGAVKLGPIKLQCVGVWISYTYIQYLAISILSSDLRKSESVFSEIGKMWKQSLEGLSKGTKSTVRLSVLRFCQTGPHRYKIRSFYSWIVMLGDLYSQRTTKTESSDMKCIQYTTQTVQLYRVSNTLYVTQKLCSYSGTETS